MVRKAAIAGLLAAGLLAPAARAQTAVPSLAGVNVIQGSNSGYVEVELPQPVVVDTDFNATTNGTFTLEGGGSLAAVGLEADDGTHTNPSVVVQSWDPAIFCHATCANPYPLLGVNQHDSVQVEGKSNFLYRIPAGRYRVYLITAGQPARATIRLPELSGEQALAPDHPVRSTVVINPRHDPAATDNAAVFGSTGTLDTYGMVLTEGIAYQTASAQHIWQECSYNGVSTNPLAYYPGCPTDLGQDQAGGAVFPNEYSPSMYSGAHWSEPGTWGEGANYDDPAVVNSVGWASAWIDLE